MALPKITQEINTIKSTYLPKSGGVMTGNLAVSNMYCNKMSSSTTWGVGTTWNDAPSISLYGPNETSSGIPDCFSIRAGANKYALTGTPDGNLYWGGNNVITSAGGTINGSLSVNGTIVSVNGNIEAPNGNIKGARFTADNHVNDNIDFMFKHVTKGGMYLPGTYARNDEWYAITSLKGSYYGGTNNYRLWADGLIEQWGYVGGLNNGNVWITFPVAFTSTDYCLLTFARGRSAGSDFSIGSDTYYTTGITVSWDGHPNDPAYINWYAVGY